MSLMGRTCKVCGTIPFRSKCSLMQGMRLTKYLQRMCGPSCRKSCESFPTIATMSLILPSSCTASRTFHLSLSCKHKHSAENHRSCWNCGRDTSPVTELFFCDCGVVQKPASELTFFDLMQLNTSFDIDTKRLGAVFRETQMRLHPDKFSTNSKEEQELAQQQSSLLNKAYDTLLKPLSRAIYMLKLQNIKITEQDNFTDPQFFMEIMEINEEISMAKKATDLEILEVTNNEKITQIVQEISELFRKNSLQDVKIATIKLRYYTTIQEKINEVKHKSFG